MVTLDINRRPGWSINLRPDYMIQVSGNAMVYQINPGKEPKTLAIVSGTQTFGPYTEVTPLMVTAISGQVDISDPILAVGGGDTDADITAAKSVATVRSVTAAATINTANHLGQLLEVTATGAVTITLATDLADGASGTILTTGTGEVTIAAQSGTVNVAADKAAIIAGRYQAVQWIKLGANFVLLGALKDAA